MKMKDLVSKKEVLNKNEKVLAWSVEVGEKADPKEDFEIAAEAKEKSFCPTCLVNAGSKVDVSGKQSCPNCGLKTNIR